MLVVLAGALRFLLMVVPTAKRLALETKPKHAWQIYMAAAVAIAVNWIYVATTEPWKTAWPG
jgi:hypothetical protein